MYVCACARASVYVCVRVSWVFACNSKTKQLSPRKTVHAICNYHDSCHYNVLGMLTDLSFKLCVYVCACVPFALTSSLTTGIYGRCDTTIHYTIRVWLALIRLETVVVVIVTVAVIVEKRGP